MNKIIKREHIWDEENDRWILVTYDEDGNDGLNFMHGDDYETFVKDYGEPDKELSMLYSAVKGLRNWDIVILKDRLQLINRTCWAWLKLKGN